MGLIYNLSIDNLIILKHPCFVDKILQAKKSKMIYGGSIWIDKFQLPLTRVHSCRSSKSRKQNAKDLQLYPKKD